MTKRPIRYCSIEGCDRPIKGHGWCGTHYARWRRNGSPELRIPYREPGKFFREVVTLYEGNDCLIWPFARNLKGYGQVSYDGRQQLVSRLVCEQEHGAPPTPNHQAAHSCGNGHSGCVAKRHLSWKTSKENHHDQLLHGTRLFGERRATKLTEDQVRHIKEFARQKRESQRQIAERFGVSKRTIQFIIHGEMWARVD